MKVRELIAQLKDANPDFEVTIDLTGPNLSPCSTVSIDSTADGFDWQYGQFVLIPSRPVDYYREKCKYCHIPDNDDFKTEMFCSDFENHEYTFVGKFKGKTVFKKKYRTENIDGKFKFIAV